MLKSAERKMTVSRECLQEFEVSMDRLIRLPGGFLNVVCSADPIFDGVRNGTASITHSKTSE